MVSFICVFSAYFNIGVGIIYVLGGFFFCVQGKSIISNFLHTWDYSHVIHTTFIGTSIPFFFNKEINLI
jgi:hypothetical protein